MPRYTVTVRGREFDISLDYHADRLTATVNGKERQISFHRLGDTRSLMLIDNKSHEIDVRGNGAGGEKIVFMRGNEIPVLVEDFALAQMRKAAGVSAQAQGPGLIKAPMPGLVVTVKVEPGQKVKTGDPVLIVEAMKMENVIKATAAGTVKAIHVKTGQSIEKDDKLVEFE